MAVKALGQSTKDEPVRDSPGNDIIETRSPYASRYARIAGEIKLVFALMPAAHTCRICQLSADRQLPTTGETEESFDGIVFLFGAGWTGVETADAGGARVRVHPQKRQPRADSHVEG